MHVEALVEEPSAEAALRNLLPRIIGPGATFDVHVHGGKPDLLAKLPGRLQGYSYWLPDDWRVVALIDEDRENCQELKRQMDEAARLAGLRTPRTSRPTQPVQVVNRLAVEELEAWFFGDVPALVTAYPGVSPALGARAGYRNPDAIQGGTWEALERVLQKAGYYPGGLPKIEVARNVSLQMDPDRNTSPSFRLFRDSLRTLVGGSSSA